MPKQNAIKLETVQDIVELCIAYYEERDTTEALAKAEDRDLTYEEREYLGQLSGEVMKACGTQKTTLTRILLAYIKHMQGSTIVVARELPPNLNGAM